MPSQSFRQPPARPRPTVMGRIGGFIRRLLMLGLFAVVALVALAIGLYVYFDRDLPSEDALRTYKSPQVTKVVCADGRICAEYFQPGHRRTDIDIETLPKHVRNSFLAAEDADFYNHEGLDYVGMARAAVKGLTRPGSRMGGASTISQQVCRNALLSQERTLSRKVKEWILTPRIERVLTKDQILNLYVNQVYFGHGRYGVEEAALFYFGKRAKDLSIGEAATLAGTVQLPHRINPVTNIVKAKKRQRYVLNQLANHGFLPRAVIETELDKDILLSPRVPELTSGAYYAEEIRRQLVSRYGEKTVLEGGLRVEIAMDPTMQDQAVRATQEGLEQMDKRLGFRGALGTLPKERFARMRTGVEERLKEAGRRGDNEVLVADLSALAQVEKEVAGVRKEGREELADELRAGTEPEEPEAPANEDEAMVRSVVLEPLAVGLRLGAYVRGVNDAKGYAEVDLVSRTARIPMASIGWAKQRKGKTAGVAPKKVSDVVAQGQIVRVKITKLPSGPKDVIEATLDQIPEVQGALVSIDPLTRHVVALVGGYDFGRSPFNRAVQAQRQPGSAFKPFLYAAALASGSYTSLSIVNDAPEAIRDPWTGKVWKPLNHEKTGFAGPMTLRQALTQSKNTVSVRLIEAITPQVAIDFARRAGITSKLPDNLTLALGTGEVSPLELTNAYTTLQSLGKFAEPLMLLKVTDAQGIVLEEHAAAFEERLPPPVAYLTTSLMQSVVEEGTAMAVRGLNRPAAGKTGTANEYRDAWFAGYTTDLVTVAWVGYDDHSSMGTGETGGRASLPLWMKFMEAASDGRPVGEFEVPEGIALVRIDPTTGLLAGESVPGRLEPFLAGTEPTSEAPPTGQVAPDQFFFQDTR